LRALFIAVLLSATIAGSYADIVLGNGRVETERRSLPAFSSVSIGGSGTLRVHRGAQKVEVSCDSNILPYISMSVSGDELSIGFKPFTNIMSLTKLEFDVTIPDLTGLKVSGSCNAYADAFKGESFSGIVSGSGGIKADLEYRTVELNSSGSGGFDANIAASRVALRCTGSGGAYFRGSADRAELSISGSGSLGARHFSAGDARVIISGSGTAEIRATKSLDVTLSGSGGLKYWGSPRVSTRISGSGRISTAGEN
jgi:hypothetical protein